jgi:RHS repeat-associated protein
MNGRERYHEDDFVDAVLHAKPAGEVAYPVGPLVKLPLSSKDSNYRSPIPSLPGSLPPGISSKPVEHPEIQCGSVIQVDSLSLGEVIPINGLPINLVYFSDRVRGRLGDYQLHVPLRDLAPPSADATLNVSLAGRTSSVQIDTKKGDSFDFLWEGLDSRGTFPIGKVLAKVKIEGQNAGGWTNFVGNFKPAYLGLGGWGLSNLHYFSKDENVIYLGNGGIQKVNNSEVSLIPSADGTEIYMFDSDGKHMSTKDGRTGRFLVSFKYDQGRISEISDSYENRIELIRDGNKIEIVGPFRRKSSLIVGDDGYLASLSNEAQETYQMKYQAGGLMTEFQKPQGQVSQFTYNNLGYLERDMGSGGNSIFFSGQIDGTSEKKIDLKMETALGRTSSYVLSQLQDGYYERKKTEANGRFSVIRYKTDDSRTLVTNEFETTTRFGKSARFDGRLSVPVSSRTIVKGLSQFPQDTTYSYDIPDQVNESYFDYNTLTSTITRNGKTTTSLFERNSGRHKSQMTVTSPMGRRISYKLDTLGNPLSATVGSYLPLERRYNGEGQLTESKRGKRLTSFSYDKNGNLDSVVDPLSRETRFSYDESGRVKKQVQSDGRVIEYNHDRNGNLIGITPPGRPAHQFSLNLFELMESYLAPLVGDQGPTNTQYFYNKDKQLTEILDPSGDKLEFVYGSADGRLDRIITPQGFYGFSYNQGSQIEQIVSPYAVTNRFSYYGPLPKSQSISLAGGEENSLEFGYNRDLRVKSFKIQAGNKGGSNQTSSEITYNYDDDGLLTQAGEATIGLDPATGSVVSSTLGKVKETYGYDQEYGELKMMALSFNEHDLYQETLTRDDLGRIINKKVFSAGKKPLEFSYSYNPAGQLSSVHKDSELVSKYEYDFNGNPILKVKGGQELTSSFDTQDRLLSDSMREYAYNPRGQLRLVTDKSGGSNGPNANNAPNVPYSRQTQFNYDLVGNLVSVTLPDGKAIDYLTDGLNRRVAKKINGQLTEQYLYQSQLQIAALLDSEGRLVSRFVYGTKSNIPDYMIKGDKTYKIVSDHLGSPRFVIDTESGSLAQQIEYDEFGVVLSDSNPGFQPFGFAGGLYDRHTKLVRFGARDYDPQTGRWTSKDPIGFNGGDTNLYGYVVNDPVNGIDPTGEYLVQVVAGAIVGSITAFQNYQDASVVKGTTTKHIALSTGAGFVAGFIGGATSTLGLGGSIFGTAGGAVINNLANQYIFTGNVKPRLLMEAAAIGAVSGLAGVALSTGIGEFANLTPFGRDVLTLPLAILGLNGSNGIPNSISCPKEISDVTY